MGSHNQTLEAFGTTTVQLTTLLKICIIWFMNQAHEPQQNLRKYGLRAPKRSPTEFPARGSKIDT